MTDSRDTLFRQWSMLRRLPRHPQRMATRKMVAYLRDEGFSVTSRTVERDLAKLSAIFGFSSEEDGRRQMWFWPPQFKTLDVPGLEPATALAFSLAEKHLSHLMPPPTLKLLDPYFQRAREVLDGVRTTPVSTWRNKVRVIGVGPTLQPATVDENVQHRVYDALLNETRLQIVYKPRRGKLVQEYEFSPLALVSRQGVIYLVGPLWSYDNVIQLALHRIESAEARDQPAHKPLGFDIDAYIREQGEFNYPTGTGRIKLNLRFAADAALHLEERPLSDDQRIEPSDDHTVRLRATVLDTDDLVWWLLGFGASVEVIKPVALRRRIAKILCDAATLYQE